MAAKLAVRALDPDDFDAALVLYETLTRDGSVAGKERFRQLLDHPGSTVFASEAGQALTAMATLHILPNMTQNGRPYALIENVISLEHVRNQGHARAVMQAVVDTAWGADCYKVMLLTGQDTGARSFYEKLGFRADQKFGMQLRRVPPRKPNRT